MSSVGSSDSAERAADKNRLRRTREEYQQRESDLIKRQNIEARRAAERHVDEIDGLKTKHSEQMDSARVQSHDAISERDHRYQREIEDIRNLHRKQLQSTADESSQREKISARALRGDQEQSAKHNDERFKKLSDDFETQSRTESTRFNERARESREITEQSVKNMREKLNARHEGEIDHLRTTLQDKIAEGQTDFSKYRRQVDAQRREADVHQFERAKEQGERLMSAVKSERLDRAENEAHLKEDYAAGLAGERERFGRALTEREEQFAEAGTQFRTQASSRGTEKVNALRRENKELRSQSARNLAQAKHAAGQELTHARESFQKNVDAYRRERDEAYAQAGAGDRAEVSDMREKLEQRARDVEQRARTKLNDQTEVFKREYENLKNQGADRLEQKEGLTERRVEHILSETTDEKTRLTQLNADVHEAAQRNKQDEIKALRHTLEGDKREQVEAMREMMRKQELRHADRMGSVVAKYDKQIQSLKDEMVRERRVSGENQKRSVEELSRAHQLDLDQAEVKSRAKMNEANARHDQEMRSISKRYEEKLDQVLAEMKRS